MKKSLLFSLFVVFAHIFATAQLFNETTDPNTCPAGWTKVDPTTLTTVAGKVCVNGGELRNPLGGNGQLFITANTKFSAELSKFNGSIYNFSNDFFLNSNPLTSEMRLENYGKIREESNKTFLNASNGFIDVYNSQNDTIVFNNSTTFERFDFENEGTIIFNNPVSMDASTDLNNFGFLTLEKGFDQKIGFKGYFNNKGLVDVRSEVFNIQTQLEFHNTCQVNVEGDVEIGSYIELAGQIIYTGVMKLTGDLATTSLGEVQGGELQSTGNIGGSGKFWFSSINSASTGYFGIGDNDMFTINFDHPQQLYNTSSFILDTNLPRLDPKDLPSPGCSDIVLSQNNLVANEDFANEMCEGEFQSIPVLKNDDLGQGTIDDFFIEIIDPGFLGDVRVAGPEVEFYAHPHMSNFDYIEYRFCEVANPDNCSNNAFINVTVSATNDPMTSKRMERDVLMDQSITVSIFEVVNDSLDYLEFPTPINQQIDLSTLQLNTAIEPQLGSIKLGIDGQLNKTGDIIITPAPGVNDTVIKFEYEVCDFITGSFYCGDYTKGICITDSVIINVRSLVIDEPLTPYPDSITLCEDNFTVINVLENDELGMAPIADVKVELLNSQGNLGEAKINQNRINYTPALDAFGTDTIYYRLCNNIIGECSEYAFVKFNISPINDSMLVLPVIVSTDVLTPVTIDLSEYNNDDKDYMEFISNMDKIDYDNITVLTSLDQSLEGELAKDVNMFVFTPAEASAGTEVNIDYLICDKGNGVNTCMGEFEPICLTNRVTVNVLGSDSPILESDSVLGLSGDTLWEDTKITINPFINDFDPNDNGVNNLGDIDISTLEVRGKDGVLGKTNVDVGDAIVDVVNGLITISPKLDLYTGIEVPSEFEYYVEDAQGFRAGAVVSFKIWAKNDNPVASFDEITIDQREVAKITVLDNDNDEKDKIRFPKGGIGSVSISSNHPVYNFLGQPSHGLVTLSGDTIKYIPEDNFFGTDSFYYAIEDVGYGEGSFSQIMYDTALVLVNVLEVKEVVTLPKVLKTLFEDETLPEFDLNSYISSVVSPLSVLPNSLIIEKPNHGSMTENEGVIKYTPGENEIMNDTIMYSFADEQDDAYVGIIVYEINPINDSMTVEYEAGSYVARKTTEERQVVSINWASSFTDINDTEVGLGGLDISSFNVFADWSNGATVSNTNGVLSYQANAGFYGVDILEFEVCDIPNAGPNEIDGQDSMYCTIANLEVTVTLNTKEDPELKVDDRYVPFDADPFYLYVLTKSEADVNYEVTSSECISVSNEGLVTVTCVDTAYVKVYQEETEVHRRDSTLIQIVAQKINSFFDVTRQNSAVGGSDFLLTYQTNFDQPLTFTVIGDTSIASVSLTGIITPIKEGEVKIRVAGEGSEKYASFYEVVTIYVLPDFIAPVANNDVMTLNIGESASVNLLANDSGVTGYLVGNKIDIDVEFEEVQNKFFDDKGTFSVDTLGNLTFTPFEGFIGKYNLRYTVQDNNEVTSNEAIVEIEVKSLSPRLELKANEIMTPNDDGVNDALVIGYSNENNSNKLVIYDEHGNEIYSEVDYKNDWMGTSNDGTDLPVGAYFFNYQEDGGDEGQDRKLKSFFHIVR